MNNKFQFPIAVALLLIGLLSGFIWGNRKDSSNLPEIALLQAPQGIPIPLLELLSSNPAVLNFRVDVEIGGTITELNDNSITIAAKDGEPIKITTNNLTVFYDTTNSIPPVPVPIFSPQDVKIGDQVIVSATVDEGALKAVLIRPYTP